MPFFTELPGDEYGNRGYTASQAQVIEGIKVFNEFSKRADDIQVKTESFARRWHIVKDWNFIEVDGPARTLSESEYVDLIQRFGAAPRHIDAARIRANASERH